jgi:hypothetical protein
MTRSDILIERLPRVKGDEKCARCDILLYPHLATALLVCDGREAPATMTSNWGSQPYAELARVCSESCAERHINDLCNATLDTGSAQ